MKRQNLVNMDTRTVLSCIPFADYCGSDKNMKEIEAIFSDKSLFLSLSDRRAEQPIAELYHFVNHYKMFSEAQSELVPLHELRDWRMSDQEMVCETSAPFKVIFCDISVEGREVTRWNQPLFEAIGKAVFGLFFTVDDKGMKKFLIKARPEIGCFDHMEIGPTLQLEPNGREDRLDEMESLFLEMYRQNRNVKYNVVLSEEGGRFYHEQNHNVIIEMGHDAARALPPGYFGCHTRR